MLLFLRFSKKFHRNRLEIERAILLLDSPRDRTPGKYDGNGGGGGGREVELNLKPIKIQILGQFGTLKNKYI